MLDLWTAGFFGRYPGGYAPVWGVGRLTAGKYYSLHYSFWAITVPCLREANLSNLWWIVCGYWQIFWPNFSVWKTRNTRKVFLGFPNFNLCQNLLPLTLADFIIGCWKRRTADVYLLLQWGLQHRLWLHLADPQPDLRRLRLLIWHLWPSRQTGPFIFISYRNQNSTTPYGMVLFLSYY